MITASPTRCITSPQLRGAALRSAHPTRLKVCSKCARERELRLYVVDHRAPDGLSYVCGVCRHRRKRILRAERRTRTERRALARLSRARARWQDTVACVLTLKRAAGNWNNLQADLMVLARSDPRAQSLIAAAMLNCAAAAYHLRAEVSHLEAELEREKADAATDQEVVDAAVDVILRQPRRRRQEIVRVLEHRGPERYTWEDGGGI